MTRVGAADLAGDIGRRLAAHRGRRGIRVAELAREVGVTPSLISQIERGQSRPSVSTLFALAQALDVPVDAFCEPAPVEAPQAAAAGEPTVGAAQGVTWAGPEQREIEGRYVVRRGNRAVIDIEGGVRWERLGPGKHCAISISSSWSTVRARSPTRPSTRTRAPRWS